MDGAHGALSARPAAVPGADRPAATRPGAAIPRARPGAEPGAQPIRGAQPRGPALAERSLYPPVKAFLEARGWVVKGEVRGCDAVAVAPGAEGRDGPAVAVAELKLGFSLDLVLQGVDRMAVADAVWLAVPNAARGRLRDRRVVRLCRLLGFGLLAVTPQGGVAVLAEPEPYRPRPSAVRRRRLLAEHAAREGDPMAGGSVRSPVMTAYRQRALACAQALSAGPLSTRALAAVVPDAATIVRRNVYGWFERERRGVYRLAASGGASAARSGQEGGKRVLF